MGFPANAKSIGRATDVCGDSAGGVHIPCLKFNHWETFAQALAKEEARTAAIAARAALVKRCVRVSRTRTHCLLRNSCRKHVQMVCETVSQEAGRRTRIQHKMELPGGASGVAKRLFCDCKAPTLLTLSGIIRNERFRPGSGMV